MVNGSTTDAIAIGQLTLRVVLWHIHDECELVLGNHVHHIVGSLFIRPADGFCFYAIVVEELGRTTCGIYLVTLLN